MDLLGWSEGGQLDQLDHGAVLADVQEGDLTLVLPLVSGDLTNEKIVFRVLTNERLVLPPGRW